MANFYSTLKGIPIDYLVATPLLAAARANLALAANMQEFIFTVGYKDGKPGNDPSDTNIISFVLTRPYTDPTTGNVTTQTITVNAPLIGLVPIPALLVDNVTVDFTTTVGETSTSSESVNATVDASYGFGAFQVSGKVTTAVSHQRQSNQTATYTFHVQADQQPATEGMNQLMDVMASCVVPIPSGGSSGGGGGSSSSSGGGG